jgi:ATP-dependent DNA helicase RecG
MEDFRGMKIEKFFSLMPEQEDIETEFKAAAGGLPTSVWETICAFGNTNGGRIFLGIQEKNRNIKIIGVSDPEQLKNQVHDLSHNLNKISFDFISEKDVLIQILEGKSILSIRIQAMSANQKPIYINNNPYTGTYIRRHEGDYRCSKQEVDRMIRDSQIEGADSAIMSGFEINDLDENTLDAYRQQFRQLNPASSWNNYNQERFLEAIQGIRVNRQTGKKGLTRAAILMFGKSETILDVRSRHLIDFRVMQTLDSDNSRWQHRIAWEGNLFEAFYKIYPLLIEPLKVPFKLKGPFRLTETKAHEVLRECLVNMLAHTDYAETAALLIKSASNGFYFRNPGTSRVSEDDLFTGDRSDPRNPILLRMLRHVSLAEEGGQGFPKIIQVWRDAGLQLPVVENDSVRYEFALTLRLVHLIADQDREWLTWCARQYPQEGQQVLPSIASLTENEQVILLLAQKQGIVNNAIVQAQTGLHRADVTDLLVDLKKRGLLEQKSARRWATYELPEKIRHEYDNRFSQKTYKEKPIKKKYKEKIKTTIKENIIEVCKIPKSAEEIANGLGKNRIYLVTNYLTPMIKQGFIVYTNPENPKNKNQKYMTRNGKK